MSEDLLLAPGETKLNVAFVDQSFDAKLAAHQEAVRLRTERLNEGGRFSKFTKGIWDNIAGDYRQLRDSRTALREIQSANNVQAFEDLPANLVDSTRLATLDRFTSQYEETVHTEAGERREILPSELDLVQEIKQLIRRNVEGTLSDEALPEERTRILNAYSETQGGGILQDSQVTIDNLFAIRDAVNGAIENGESLDRVLQNMTVSIGESRSGVRTEANYNSVDRVIDKLNQTKLGSLIGPEVVATAATVAASLLRFGSRKVVGAAALTVAPGASAGLWAGLRENKRVKDERSDHSRDMAQGKEFEAGSKRREEMEQARYETVAAADLAGEIARRFGADVNLDDPAALAAALDTLTAVQARIRLSDQRKIDLISYSDGHIEEQRFALDIALAQAKSMAELQLDPAVRLALGVSPEATVQDILNLRAGQFIESLEEDISTKDAAFKKLKRRRVAIASATGVIAGLTIGAIAQEGIAAMSDSRQGLVEQMWHAHNSPFEGQQHQTLLNGLVHGEGGQSDIIHHVAETNFDHSTLGEHAAGYSVSADHNLIDNGNGTLDLVDPTGHATIDNLPMNPDGSLPQASLDVLRGHGMSVVDTTHNVDIVTTQTHQVSVDQYVANHPDLVTHVARDGWYDENTPAPVFDKNELGLHWGGDTGLNDHDGYTMSVATMTHDGSFSGDHATDWAVQAKAGNLQLAISASGNTQSEVFMVPIGADGKIDITAGSPAAQFFSNENGHAVFNGAYAEVVQNTGIDTHGVEHMRPLATFVGHDNVGHVADTIQTHTPQLHHEYTITTNGYDTTEHFDSFTEMAPVIPIISRRGMETVRGPERMQPPHYYGERGESSAEEIEAQRRVTSPRLLDNPEAQLNPQEELAWYKSKLAEVNGEAYVQAIEDRVSASPELNNLSPEIRSIITIPVKAAGNAESKNIYSVIANMYAQQDRGALAESTMLLHVNWFKSAEQDPALMENITRTQEEIKRAQRDFPYLKIATIESQWGEELKEGGIIGHVARRMNEAALFAVSRGIEAGTIPSDRDVVIIRNDADPRGMSKTYLKHFNDASKGNSEIDVFTGTTQFGSERARQLPGLVLAANFMQSINIISSLRGEKLHTGGANFGIRAATLAAIGVGMIRDANGNEDNGAGSDDVRVGGIINKVRNGGLNKSSTYKNSGGVSGYYRAWRGRNGSGTGSSAATPTQKPKRNVGLRVNGARIDTDSDRQEAFYLQGRAIANSWEDGFDRDGHKERDADLDNLRTENLAKFKDPQFLLESIRKDMETTISYEGSEGLATVRTSLAFMFAGGKKNAGQYYNLTPRRRQDGSASSIKFSFTEDGKKYILQSLARDSRGRFDPYGNRLDRQLYGRTK
ncbi:MAG: hypothetical protein ABI716_02775, partial [Candidatus Saccharibacteria bacterium]